VPPPAALEQPLPEALAATAATAAGPAWPGTVAAAWPGTAAPADLALAASRVRPSASSAGTAPRGLVPAPLRRAAVGGDIPVAVVMLRSPGPRPLPSPGPRALSRPGARPVAHSQPVAQVIGHLIAAAVLA
jgi:hypothetical protein